MLLRKYPDMNGIILESISCVPYFFPFLTDIYVQKQKNKLLKTLAK